MSNLSVAVSGFPHKSGAKSGLLWGWGAVAPSNGGLITNASHIFGAQGMASLLTDNSLHIT